MYTLSSLSAAIFQQPYGMTDSQTHWLIAFTGITALAVLLEAIAFIVLAIAAAKLLTKITEFTTVLEHKVYPVLDNVKDVVNDSVPKVKRVTTNIADTSDVYRAKLAQIDALITDTADKAKKQSDRVDGMVTDTLQSATSLASRVENAVMAPIRQGSAIFAGIRATAEQLVKNYTPRHIGSTPPPRPVAFEGENIYTGVEDDYHA